MNIVCKNDLRRKIMDALDAYHDGSKRSQNMQSALSRAERDAIEAISADANRTNSDIIRDAVRVYLFAYLHVPRSEGDA